MTLTPATPAARFAKLAERYVDLIERHDELSLSAFVSDAHPLVVDLDRAALDLPAVDPSEADLPDQLTSDEWARLFESLRCKFGQRDWYTEMFDPYAQDDTPVPHSLSDDLTDIYRDVRHGLSGWRGGRTDDAVWEWRFSFETHWGRHATSALRALHALVYDRGLVPCGVNAPRVFHGL